jgi:hypothetical protein
LVEQHCMTQSKKDDSFTVNVSNLKLDDILDTTGDIIINLNDTYGTTTTYTSDYTSITSSDNYTYIVSDDAIDLSNINITWPLDNSIDPDEIERMCKEYPALEKTWRNFKATYDLVKQDWKGKQDEDNIS